MERYAIGKDEKTQAFLEGVRYTLLTARDNQWLTRVCIFEDFNKVTIPFLVNAVEKWDGNNSWAGACHSANKSACLVYWGKFREHGRIIAEKSDIFRIMLDTGREVNANENNFSWV
jgi:hypothetical protein